MSKEKQYEYGCEVCKHRSKCEPTPFGICRDFEREETPKKHFTPEEVRKMSQSEVRDNYEAILQSMKTWY